MNHTIQTEKLKLYGVDFLSFKWFLLNPTYLTKSSKPLLIE